MIVQRVLKGIGGISRDDARGILEAGILCNWWRTVGVLPETEVKQRLTQRNLHWHQNNYDKPDPREGGQPFREMTPFISTTAGSVERDPVAKLHIIRPALEVALEFATGDWSHDGFIYYCYLFILGRPVVAHRAFSEELRELHVYSGFSPWQPEGEITAKILIPTAQIERVEHYRIDEVLKALDQARAPTPCETIRNAAYYQPPDDIVNLRDVIS